MSSRLIFDANPLPMVVADLETHKFLAVNDAAVAFYGYPRGEFLSLTIRDIRPESASGEIAAFINSKLDEHDPVSSVVTHRTASGEEHLMQFTGRRLDYEGRPAVLAALFDLTNQRRMEDQVKRAQAFLIQVVDQIPTAVFAKDMGSDGRYLIYNRASEALVGRNRADVIGRTDREIFDPETATRFSAQDDVALRLGSIETIDDEVVHRPDGEARSIRTRKVGLPARPGEQPTIVLGVSEDMTNQRASLARIAHMAHHDALTDLPNRFLFGDRLASALARQRENELLAVLFVDLDGFKAVNDTHGHATGDALLRQVADRLRATLRSCDTAARFGGDEFAILQSVISDPGETTWLAAKLVSSLSAPYGIDQRCIRISASIGIAFAWSNAVDASELLEKADAALYQAKREGKKTFRIAAGTSTDEECAVSPCQAPSRGRKVLDAG